MPSTRSSLNGLLNEDEFLYAVRIFQETLEKTYLDNGDAFYGIGVDNLDRFFTGKCSMTRRKDGSIHMSGHMPKVMFRDDLTSIPSKMSDYTIFPLVIRLFQKEFKDE